MNDSLISLLQQKKIRRWIVIVGAAICIMIILAVLAKIPLQAGLDSRSVAFSGNAFSYLDDEYIYSFNGDAFTRTNVQTGQSTVLMNGVRLPEVKNVWWAGDKGAVVKLGGNFDYTTFSNSSQFMSETGLNISEDQLWFIDFASRELHSITELSPSNALYFDGEGIVFTGDTMGVFSLNRYDISTNTNTYLSSLPETVSSINSITGKDKNYTIIGTLRESTKSIIFQTSLDDKSLREVTQTEAFITPTNNPDIVIFSKDQSRSDDSSTTKDDHDYVDAGPYTISQYSLSDKRTIDLNDTVVSSDIIPISVQSGLYIIDGGTMTFRTQSLLRLPLSITKENAGFVLPAGYHDQMFMLRNSNRQYQLYSSSLVHGVLTQTQQPPTQLVDTCVEPYEGSVNYISSDKEYAIFVFNSDQLTTTIKTISDCIHADPTKVFGYNFSYSIVSDQTGRVISN